LRRTDNKISFPLMWPPFSYNQENRVSLNRIIAPDAIPPQEHFPNFQNFIFGHKKTAFVSYGKCCLSQNSSRFSYASVFFSRFIPVFLGDAAFFAAGFFAAVFFSAGFLASALFFGRSTISSFRTTAVRAGRYSSRIS